MDCSGGFRTNLVADHCLSGRLGGVVFELRRGDIKRNRFLDRVEEIEWVATQLCIYIYITPPRSSCPELDRWLILPPARIFRMQIIQVDYCSTVTYCTAQSQSSVEAKQAVCVCMHARKRSRLMMDSLAS